MRRGTSVSFWRKYEAQQVQLVAACMPKTAALRQAPAFSHTPSGSAQGQSLLSAEKQ